MALLVVACGGPQADLSPTDTPDIALLETRTEAQLAARLTAIAPSPTASPVPTDAPATPIPTPTSTITVTPVPTGYAPPLVVVHGAQGEAANIVAPAWAGEERVLTHFTELMSFYSLRWLADGSELYFVSSHDFAFSRNTERNVFTMHPDGTGLQMVTGDYVSPETVQGPFLTLEGRVEGATGACRVTAQGLANLVDTDADGAFVLEGVSQSAGWARAVCQDGTTSLHGDIDLDLELDRGPVTITVTAGGEGWRDVQFSPDGQRFVGTFYEWHLDDQGAIAYTVEGVLYDLASGPYATLALPEGATFHGACWSPDGQRIIGGLSDEESAYLWQWDTQGASIGELLKVDNPEDQLLSIARPVWSLDGTKLVYELHRWYWWADEKFRTDLVQVEADGQNPVTLVEADWGWHATQVSWADGGAQLLYQYYQSDTDLGGLMPAQADIWSLDMATLERQQLTQDGASFLPAARPDGGS